MESLFTRSPHSITAFTRSQLTSFPTTGYSIPFSPCFFFFFFLSTQENILIALLNISHIPQPTYCPPTDSHKRTQWSHWNIAHTRAYRHRDTHQYSKLSRVWHITTKAHISKSQSLSFFISALFATIETDWKAQREGGGVYCSNQPSLPVQSQHGTRQPSALKYVRSVWRQSGAKTPVNLWLCMYVCLCAG